MGLGTFYLSGYFGEKLDVAGLGFRGGGSFAKSEDVCGVGFYEPLQCSLSLFKLFYLPLSAGYEFTVDEFEAGTFSVEEFTGGIGIDGECPAVFVDFGYGGWC